MFFEVPATDTLSLLNDLPAVVVKAETTDTNFIMTLAFKDIYSLACGISKLDMVQYYGSLL